MEYLPTNGLKDFVQHSLRLAFGEDSKHVAEGTIASVQSLSGTGSCRLSRARRFSDSCRVQGVHHRATWSNHHNIWRDAGCEQDTFRYYKESTRGLDFEGLMEDVEKAPNGSMFLLHRGCARQPHRRRPGGGAVEGDLQLMKSKDTLRSSTWRTKDSRPVIASSTRRRFARFVEDGHKVASRQSIRQKHGLVRSTASAP